mgnify:CR=1 FL=1
MDAALVADAPDRFRAARAEALAPAQLARDEAVPARPGRRRRGRAAPARGARRRRGGADRLAALDADRAAWRERVAAYRAERRDRRRSGARRHGARQRRRRLARPALQRSGACASTRSTASRWNRPVASPPVAVALVDCRWTRSPRSGFTAATLTTCSFVPQLTRIWRTKSAHDLSLRMFSRLQPRHPAGG